MTLQIDLLYHTAVAGIFQTQTQDSLFNCNWHVKATLFRGTLAIRALVMGDRVPCYGALETVGLLLFIIIITLTKTETIFGAHPQKCL